MARRFASSTKQEIEKLLKQKDSENKNRLTKIAKELFHEYFKEKSVQKPKTRRTQMLKLFAVILFTCKTMYNKTIIRFGFCDIRNNQGHILKVELVSGLWTLDSGLFLPKLNPPPPKKPLYLPP